MNSNKVIIDLGFANLVAEKSEYTVHPELYITLETKDGELIQDIALVSQAITKGCELVPDAVRCLIWADKDDEDFTDEFIIEKYDENEEFACEDGI